MKVVFVLFFLPSLVISNYQPILTPKECQFDAELNTIKPWTGDLVKIKSVNKGSLYTAGTGDDKIYVVHVYGTPYEMGYAHGVLLSSQIKEIIPEFLELQKKATLINYGQTLSLELKIIIKTKGLNYALDNLYKLTKKYTPKYFYEEMKGLADGSGLDYKTIIRFHMYPELIKGECSMLGAWGDATNGQGLIQLRALDWDIHTVLQKYPTVLVYHPNDGHSFLNNAWAGFIATVAGMSSSGLAISQKKVDIPRKEVEKGIPFTFIMRDVLQFDTSLYDSMRRFENADRTSSMWLGIGDGKEKIFRMIDYYTDDIQVYDEYNVTKIDKERYSRQWCTGVCTRNFAMKDLLFWGNYLYCQKKLLHQYYGRITSEAIVEFIGAVGSGRFMTAVYDLEKFEMFVSNARAKGEKGPANAFNRQFVKFDVQALFNEPEPVITFA